MEVVVVFPLEEPTIVAIQDASESPSRLHDSVTVSAAPLNSVVLVAMYVDGPSVMVTSCDSRLAGRTSIPDRRATYFEIGTACDRRP